VPTYREIPASSRLARYVECYWSREDSDGTAKHRVLPDGCVDVLFTTQDGEPVDLSIVGLMTAPQIFDVQPGCSFFGVRFRPGMAQAFLPGAARLNDKTEALENVIGSHARCLLEQLAESSTPAGMARVMEASLRPLEPPDAVDRALQQLPKTGLTVDALASATGVSLRQLRRLCLDRAGVSPKYLIRILRFRDAAARISKWPSISTPPNWAEFAAACGYYDQAHFIREFQEFTGATPGRFLQSLLNRDP
jgi:AraC-like DNA-binding protein